MSDKKKTDTGKDKNVFIVWGVTAFLALVIIGGAVYISQSRNAGPPAPITAERDVAQSPRPDKVTGPLSEKTQTPRPGKSSPQTRTQVPAPSDTSKTVEAAPALDVLAANKPGEIPVFIPAMQRWRYPLEFSCYRSNVSPPLKWGKGPRKTKSYAVFFAKITDETPPKLYWGLYDIGSKTLSLPKDRGGNPGKDGGQAVVNDYGNLDYTGPCEPKGRKTYKWYVFALDKKLDLSGAARKDDVLRAMDGHVLDVGILDVIHYLRQ